MSITSIGEDKGAVAGSCCAYKKSGAGSKGYDCVIIPGARNTATSAMMAMMCSVRSSSWS